MRKKGNPVRGLVRLPSVGVPNASPWGPSLVYAFNEEVLHKVSTYRNESLVILLGVGECEIDC